MKKVLALMTLCAAVSVSAMPDMHEKYSSRIIEKLELEGDRATEVQMILEEAHEQRKFIHEEVRGKMKALHEAQKEKLAQVLNEEEMEQLQKTLRTHKKQHEHQRGEKLKKDCRSEE